MILYLRVTLTACLCAGLAMVVTGAGMWLSFADLAAPAVLLSLLLLLAGSRLLELATPPAPPLPPLPPVPPLPPGPMGPPSLSSPAGVGVVGWSASTPTSCAPRAGSAAIAGRLGGGRWTR